MTPGGPDVLVLGYHAVSRTWDDALAVRPDDLHAQVVRLLDRGYVPATFTAAVHDPPAARTLAVTFDDACASVLRTARPVLDALGVPGTVFAPSAWVGRPGPMRWDGIEPHADGPHAAELQCLGWDDLRALAAAGWEVGSHTVDHPRLTGLDDARLDAQLAASRDVIAAGVGVPVTSVAYPYGAVDARVVAAAGRAGYVAGAGLPSPPHPPRVLDWPRVGVYRRDGPRRFARKTSRMVRRGRVAVGR
jgi:peptidoglycan/xylan/chitin deacetylase (PgdA/CDA1 family)